MKMKLRRHLTPRASREPNVAGFRLPVAGAGNVERESVANPDLIEIYPRRFQVIDVQKNISGPPASSAINPKPRSAFHIFSFPAPIYFPNRKGTGEPGQIAQ